MQSSNRATGVRDRASCFLCLHFICRHAQGVLGRGLTLNNTDVKVAAELRFDQVPSYPEDQAG